MFKEKPEEVVSMSILHAGIVLVLSAEWHYSRVKELPCWRKEDLRVQVLKRCCALLWFLRGGRVYCFLFFWICQHAVLYLCAEWGSLCSTMYHCFLSFLYHFSQKCFRQSNLASYLLFPTRTETTRMHFLGLSQGVLLLYLMTLRSAATYMGSLQKIRTPPIPSAMMVSFLIAWILMTILFLFVLFCLCFLLL